MQSLPTRIQGPLLIQPSVLGDERGFFVETYRRSHHEEIGIPVGDEFIQDNHSRSSRGVVRGMHFHVGAGVSKLVRCGRGRILDVVVDLRRGSPSYGEWEGFELDDELMRELYVPVGFAHGFCVLSEVADVIYKQTAYYDPQIERGIAWDDPDVGVRWPIPEDELVVSDRDSEAPRLSEIAAELPFGNEQTVAEVDLLEAQEILVALLPASRVEIVSQAVEAVEQPTCAGNVERVRWGRADAMLSPWVGAQRSYGGASVRSQSLPGSTRSPRTAQWRRSPRSH
jgi:dTDP-4-dehydrorhamnose 3,5-epimerase